MNVYLLTDGAWKVGELKKRLDAAVGELAFEKQSQKAREVALKKMLLDYNRLELELRGVGAAISRRERVIRDFDERVCTGYTSLVRAQASSYRDCLKVLLSDTRSRVDYLRGHQVPVGEDYHSFRLGERNNSKERNGHTLLSEGIGNVLNISLPASGS